MAFPLIAAGAGLAGAGLLGGALHKDNTPQYKVADIDPKAKELAAGLSDRAKTSAQGLLGQYQEGQRSNEAALMGQTGVDQLGRQAGTLGMNLEPGQLESIQKPVEERYQSDLNRFNKDLLGQAEEDRRQRLQQASDIYSRITKIEQDIDKKRMQAEWNKYKSRKQAVGQMMGLVGSGVGMAVGGPAGAQFGNQLGTSIGSS